MIINGLQAKQLIASGAILIDVRTLPEFKSRHIEGSVCVPLDQIPTYIKNGEFNSDATYVLYCHTGGRSAGACLHMKEAGFKKVYNLGSMYNWT